VLRLNDYSPGASSALHTTPGLLVHDGSLLRGIVSDITLIVDNDGTISVRRVPRSTWLKRQGDDNVPVGVPPSRGDLQDCRALIRSIPPCRALPSAFQLVDGSISGTFILVISWFRLLTRLVIPRGDRPTDGSRVTRRVTKSPPVHVIPYQITTSLHKVQETNPLYITFIWLLSLFSGVSLVGVVFSNMLMIKVVVKTYILLTNTPQPSFKPGRIHLQHPTIFPASTSQKMYIIYYCMQLETTREKNPMKCTVFVANHFAAFDTNKLRDVMNYSEEMPFLLNAEWRAYLVFPLPFEVRASILRRIFVYIFIKSVQAKPRAGYAKRIFL
jgi:hypothetical protein